MLLAALVAVLAVPRTGRAAPKYRLDETWTAAGTAGWTNEQAGYVVLSNPGGYLNMQHIDLSSAPSTYIADTMWGAIPAGVLVTNLSLVLRAEDIGPSAARVYLRTRAGTHLWRFNLPDMEAGQAIAFNAPVRHASGWTLGPNFGEDDFLDDLRSVDAVGVYVRRHSTVSAQDIVLDDVIVEGLRYVNDTDMDGMIDPWEDDNQLNRLDWRDAPLDNDNDGMSNYAEYRAGTDPNDDTSFFTLGIRATNGLDHVSAVVLEWKSVPDRSYKVWQAPADLESFQTIAPAVTSTPPWNRYEDVSATNRAFGFYFIEVNED